MTIDYDVPPYAHDTDVPASAAASVPSWLRSRPNLAALIAALGTGAQLVEDSVWDLIVSLPPESATGDLLDRWGLVVGQPRDGMTDTDYRRWIEIRVQANGHDGTVDDLIRIWRLATGALSVRYDQLAGAYFELQAVTPLPLDAAMRARLRQLIEDIRPGGVGADLSSGTEGAFGFSRSGGAGFNVGTFSGAM